MFTVIKRNPALSFSDFCKILLYKNNRCKIDSYIYTAYARFALKNILKFLDLGNQTQILLPSYVCNAVTIVLEDLGLKPVYYGVTDKFQVNIDTININPKTKVILTINYFGLSQDFESIKKFSENKKLIWVNDNSHGFGSFHEGNNIESYGDFSLTSFRKVLPILNGARFSINNVAYKSVWNKSYNIDFSDKKERRLLRFILANFFGKLNLPFRKKQDYTNVYSLNKEKMMPYCMDEVSSKIFNIIEIEKIQKKRFSLYQAIENFLIHKKYKFLEIIPGILNYGNSPQAFPVKIKDKKYWIEVLTAGKKFAIDIHTWPDLPNEVIERNIFNAVVLWQSLVFLPIHQDIDIDKYLSRLQILFDTIEFKIQNKLVVKNC